MKKKNTKKDQGTVPDNFKERLVQKSRASRRTFMKNGLFTISGAIIAPTLTSCTNKNKSSEKNDIFSCIDYGKSFVCNTAAFNSVRMWIESRTIITDEKSGTNKIFYQGASCKSEDTFAEKNLFYKDNYDFLPIFGDGKVLVFRRYHNKRGEGFRPRSNVKTMEEMWGDNPVIYTPAPEKIRQLHTWEEIRDVTAAGIPIVTQTIFKNEETGLTAFIECPCKTMNISHPKQVYQVDTGPIAFPDLSKPYENQIDWLNLAYIAFNKPHFADLIIEAETPIIEGDKEVATVYHYSQLVTITGENKIFALG